MSKSQRSKGARREREIVAKHTDLKIKAERVPLSGAARYQGGCHDVDVYARGEDQAPLVAEVKARGDGQGFKVLERWLAENDLLFLIRDRAEPMVLMPWRSYAELLQRGQR